jgi:hypothetical protein
MPKRVAPLSLLQVKNAKPKTKPYKLFDGGGLYLELTPGGSKRWHLKYRQLNGSENRLSFGLYPDISLADARDKINSHSREFPSILGVEISVGPLKSSRLRPFEDLAKFGSIQYSFSAGSVERRALHQLPVN